MRAAVVDCGTNTIRLLVADAGPGGVPVEVVRDLRLVRLGQGVDATGTFHPDALARTFAAVDDFAARVRDLGAERVRFVATSAARDVTNRDELFAGVRARLGVEVEVVSGAEEARLAFLGALSGGPLAAGPVLVTDIGGGSTELILGGLDGVVVRAESLDVGSVRLRERLLRGDPPEPYEVAAARRHVADLVAGSGVDVRSARAWIGVAGTATSLSAMAQGLTAYDRARVHGSAVPPHVLERLTSELLSTPVDDVLARWPLLERMRAEVICAGALVVDELSRAMGGHQAMVVRETDILDGAAMELLQR